MIVKSQDELLKLIEACRHVDSEMLESEDVEFKEYQNLKSLHNSKELAEEISALANKNGGVVVVGIRDGSRITDHNWDSQLVGFEKGDVIDVEQRLKGKLKPNLDLTAKYYEIERKKLFIFTCACKKGHFNINH